MKWIIVAACGLAVAASAASYRLVSEDLSSKNYKANLQYPVLTIGAIPGSARINPDVRSTLLVNQCDAAMAAAGTEAQFYKADAKVVALNANYFTIEVTESSFCGGAHQNDAVYNRVWDSQAGVQVDMDKEVPRQDLSGDSPDWKAYAKFQLELAGILYDVLSAAGWHTVPDISQCVDISAARTEIVKQLAELSPYISGLAEAKTVLIRLSPQQVATACGVSIEVNYSLVKKYFNPSGKAARWLK